MEEELLLQNGEEIIGVNNLGFGKAIIITVTYTNKKWANQLMDRGVPCIKDESTDQSRTNALVKKTLFATRVGGGPTAVRKMWLKGAETSIEGTGKQKELPQEASVNGLELFDTLSQLATDNGINVVFLRTRERATEARLSRGEDHRGPKITTKIYFIPEYKVDEKMKKGDGSKKFSTPEAREILKELINTTWFIHVIESPESTVFSLTFRQPDNKNPSLKPSLFSFY